MGKWRNALLRDKIIVWRQTIWFYSFCAFSVHPGRTFLAAWTPDDRISLSYIGPFLHPRRSLPNQSYPEETRPTRFCLSILRQIPAPYSHSSFSPPPTKTKRPVNLFSRSTGVPLIPRVRPSARFQRLRLQFDIYIANCVGLFGSQPTVWYTFH